MSRYLGPIRKTAPVLLQDNYMPAPRPVSLSLVPTRPSQEPKQAPVWRGETAERVKAARLKTGLSVPLFAESLGVGNQAIWDLESGRAVGANGDTKRALLQLGIPAGKRKPRTRKPTAREIQRQAKAQQKLEARLAARAAMLRAKQARRALCAKAKAPAGASGKLSRPGLGEQGL